MNLQYREAHLPKRPSSADEDADTRSGARDLLQRLGITLPPDRADLLSGRVRLWHCADDSRVVGHCVGNKDTGEIMMLAVQQGYEGLGIGGKLLSIVVGWLQAEGAQRIWLVAPADPTLRAFGFYRTLGWRATGETRDEGRHQILELSCNDERCRSP